MKKTSFGKLVGGLLASKPAGLWRPEAEAYPRLAGFNAQALAGQQGIYAIWHLGVRPQWLRVGATANLGQTVEMLAAARWVATHEGNAGIFLAWAQPPADQSLGMARFLAETLKPAFQGEPFTGDRALEETVPPIKCPLPPGTQS